MLFKLLNQVIAAIAICESTKVLVLRLQASSDSEIRAVTHLNVLSKEIKKAAEIIIHVAENL